MKMFACGNPASWQNCFVMPAGIPGRKKLARTSKTPDLIPYGVVVVYHVTIVAFGQGLLKKFLPFW